MLPVTVAAIAGLCGGTAEGDEARAIKGVNALEDARKTSFRLLRTGRAAAQAASSRAGCLLVPADFDNRSRRTVDTRYKIREPHSHV